MCCRHVIIALFAAGLLVVITETSVADPTTQQLYDRVEMVTFSSSVLGTNKNFCVVLPDDYDSNLEDWPVLFLLHGRGRHERSLIDDAEARASLKAGEYVTILPDGDNSWWIDSIYGNYETYLEEVISLATAEYGLSTDPSTRALTGWSMGGYGSMRFAQTHSTEFSSISPVIGLLDYPQPWDYYPPGQTYEVKTEVFPTDPAQWPAYNPLYFASDIAGMSIQLITADEAFDRTMNENFSAELTSLGIEHEYIVLDGSHSFGDVKEALPLVVSHVNGVFDDDPGNNFTELREGIDGYQHLGAEVRSRLDGGNRELGEGYEEILVGNDSIGTGGNGVFRGLFAYGTEGIPDGVTVTDVEMVLTVKRTSLITGVDGIELRLTDPAVDMVESEVTWNEIKDYVSWNEGGGDPGSTVLSSIPGFGDELLGQTVTFEATPEFLAAVQDAVDGDDLLEMVMMSPAAESIMDERNFVGFWSDDAAAANLRPILRILYEEIQQTPGDANGDGYVNVSDLGILATNYGVGSGLGWEQGDFTGDGVVDVSDLGILATAYGTVPTAQTVPEPSAMMLMATGMALSSLFARRRRG